MITIRPRGSTDDSALALLFEEMQAYYRVDCPPRDMILTTLSALPVGVHILVAEIEAVVGFVSFSAIFPGPGLASGLFIKELFVSAGFRGRGAGRALIKAVSEVAVARGDRRVDWTADRGNSALLAFYEELGAVAQQEKVFFRLTGEALASLTGSSR